MKKLTQPWKLRRSFGSQPVGCVAGSPRPEAGIAAQVIPSQSLRWTFRKGQSPTADLPNLIVDDNWGACLRPLLRPMLRRFLNF